MGVFLLQLRHRPALLASTCLQKRVLSVLLVPIQNAMSAKCLLVFALILQNPALMANTCLHPRVLHVFHVLIHYA